MARQATVRLTRVPVGDTKLAMPVSQHHTPASGGPGERSPVEAMRRGFFQRCPACGRGRLFRAFLETAERCSGCNEELHHHRADDAPPYFVILIVGHAVVPLVLMVETAYVPPLWLHAALWLPLTLVLSLVLLPRVKGALVGLQWALRMHGFSGEDDEDGMEPLPALAATRGAGSP